MMARLRSFGASARQALTLIAALAMPIALAAQIPTDSWPTYHGDYSGRRYSTLKQINAANVKGLTLAWVYRLNTSRAGAIVGGEGPDTPPPGSPPQIKSTPLMINGMLYFSVPDHVWALDARTGREGWHYAWKTRGGRSHRQPRRRHPRQLAVLPHPRQLLSCRSTWRPGRSAGTTRSRT